MLAWFCLLESCLLESCMLALLAYLLESYTCFLCLPTGLQQLFVSCTQGAGGDFYVCLRCLLTRKLYACFACLLVASSGGDVVSLEHFYELRTRISGAGGDSYVCLLCLFTRKSYACLLTRILCLLAFAYLLESSMLACVCSTYYYAQLKARLRTGFQRASAVTGRILLSKQAKQAYNFLVSKQSKHTTF